MNVELPPFMNGEGNSKNASTLDRDITPLIPVISKRMEIVFGLNTKLRIVQISSFLMMRIVTAKPWAWNFWKTSYPKYSSHFWLGQHNTSARSMNQTDHHHGTK